MGSPVSATDDAHAFEDRQHDGGGDNRTDLSASIGAHGMHQEITFLIVLLAFGLNDPCRHRKCRNTCGSDQWVDFTAGQHTHHLAEQNADGGVEADGDQAEQQNQKCLTAQKLVGLHSPADCKAKQQRNDIRDLVLRGALEPIDHTAFPHQVAQHHRTD